MAPYSEKSKQWREKNQNFILEWRKKIDDLRNFANLENWTHERLEIEIAQFLDPDLRKIWDFASMYAARYRKSHLGEFFSYVVTEIIDYGTIEPSRKERIREAVETTRRKMYGKK